MLFVHLYVCFACMNFIAKPYDAVVFRVNAVLSSNKTRYSKNTDILKIQYYLLTAMFLRQVLN